MTIQGITLAPGKTIATTDLVRVLANRDPVGWVQEELGEHVWSKQAEILLSVKANRRTAVHSCHSVGKSFIAARIAAWFLEAHLPGDAFVVTTAPTSRQVRAILWREIGRAHAKGHLKGRTNQTEWWLTMPNGSQEIVAFGQKPSDLDPSAFQGIHARFVLVIFDEACGIPGLLWDAADTLIANQDSRFLAIGNPDDPGSEFAEVCKPGSGWNVIHIDGLASPNFTEEVIPERLQHLLISPIWVEEKRKKWGEESPTWIAKIRGQFPEVIHDGLIPIKWVKAAQERTLEAKGPSELGVDVGGGGDRSVVAHRRGPVVRIIRRDHNPDTMQTCGNVQADIHANQVTLAKVDSIGIGKGLCDRSAELWQKELTKTGARPSWKVQPVNVGSKAIDPEAFANLRAEAFWGLRERFQDGLMDIDPDDEDLAAQLVALKYRRTSSGRIQIESKEEMRRRGVSSPDDADAVALAYCQPTAKPKKTRATWGRRQG